MSWAEERRQDRLAQAQIGVQREEAAARIRIAERAASAELRRADDRESDARRGDARAARSKRRGEAFAWLSGHVTDVLFIPVIVVPGALAWSAMSSYGHDLYGGPGWLLPAFSEAAAWVFAAATTLTLRRHPGRPVWHLQAGVWVFAAAGAALNFLHGDTHPGHAAHAGIGTGAVMALVSAAGICAHQLVTAGPRRSRADRAAARLDRQAARRELAVRRAAIRSAAARVGADGSAELVYRPGLATVTARGRLRPVDAGEDLADDGGADELAALAGELAAAVAGLAAALRVPLDIPAAPPAPGPAEVLAGSVRTELTAVRAELAAAAAAVRADVAAALAARTEPAPRPVRAALPPPVRAAPDSPGSGPVRAVVPDGAAVALRAAAGQGRPRLVEVLAGEIEAAGLARRLWVPDYEALQLASGYGRSWCEKVVHDARREAAARTARTEAGGPPDPDPGARADLARTAVAS